MRHVLAMLVVATACGSPKPPPEETVIVRDNTRVLDAEGRALVSAFDATTGELVFSGMTAQLGELAVGHLLASEPCPAAPYGFLRKVTAVTKTGTGVTLATTAGSLREAIVQGSLVATGTLSGKDLDGRRGGLGLNVPLSVVVYDQDGNLSTSNDQVKVNGNVGLTLGFSVEMGFKPSYDPPFDVDISTKFIAILYIDQHNSLGIEASGHVMATGSVDLGSYYFTPITFFIGPVPVVLVPALTVSAGGYGAATAKLGFGAEEGLVIEAGVRKEYGEGFKAVFGFTPSGTATGPNLVPSCCPPPSYNLRGEAAARGSLRLYGLVGPYAELRTWAGVSGGIGQTPWWKVRGGLGGRVGVEVDLAFWEYDYGKDLFEESWDIAQASGNTPPVLGAVLPKSGTKVQLGQSVSLHGSFGDLEDGWFCCTRNWTSDREGTIGAQPTAELKHTFTLAGLHHLTVTGTDSAGLSVSGTTTVEVLNTPPVVSLVKPTPSFTWYRGVPLLLVGWATDGNQTCPSLTLAWSSSVGDPMPAASCTGSVQATFASNGVRVLTLTATDTQGATGNKTVSISIVDPPANIPPDVAILSPAPGAGFTDNGTVTLKAEVFDPDNATLTYSWAVTNTTGAQQVASGTVPGNANAGVIFSTGFMQGGLYCPSGVPTPNTLSLSVADGTGGHLVSAQVAVTCIFVPK